MPSGAPSTPRSPASDASNSSQRPRRNQFAGVTLGYMKIPVPAEVRFHNLIDTSGDCWLWQGFIMPNGYGTFRVGSLTDGTRRKVYAHRFSYTLYHGEIPPGLELDHLCRVRHCVNPDHLEPVTRRTNMMRGIALPRVRAIAAARTHCIRGHLWAENTIYYPSRPNERICKRCERERKIHRKIPAVISSPVSAFEGSQ